MFEPLKSYNALPELPPSADLETKALLKKSKTARLALQELNLTSRTLPSLSPMINTIPLREAKDSSAIENVVTTDAKLFRYAAIEGADADPHTKETYRYLTALREGVVTLKTRPISTKTAVKICQTIRNANIDIRVTPGTALRNQVTGKTIYTPPQGEDLLRKLLANWEVYLNTEDSIDPLVKMAIAHYQFEAIHPFTDGNGRTGRILNILYLMSQELIDLPILFLSSYILQNREAYYGGLLEVTAKSLWEEWVLYILDAVEVTAQQTTDLIKSISRLINETQTLLRTQAGFRQVHEVVEAIFSKPYFTIGDITKSGALGNRDTVSRRLGQLVELGILDVMAEGRPKVFYQPQFLSLLTADRI